MAVDVEMNTVDGYAMSSWERGYGDFEMARTSRRCADPVARGTALCLADLAGATAARRASPRQILRAQLDRLAERGLEAFAGTELEFIVFKDTYEEAFEQGLPRPRAGQPLQPRLLAARHRARRAADRRIRTQMARPG
jgi:glutamine synthetase